MKLLTAIIKRRLLRSKNPFTFTSRYDNQLDYMGIEHLGLYVHIPFCAVICDFCPYCKQVYQKALADKYIDALLKEIELVCKKQTDKKRVTSLYFGGGSPAIVADRLSCIILKLKEYFIIEDGIGVELHPDDVTPKTLAILNSAGITRISIGVQSFSESCLKNLGRETINKSELFNNLKSTEFETVAMDFIFALDGQNFSTIKADIETAFNGGANHVALYPFIDFALMKSNVKKMSSKDMKKLLYKIYSYCNLHGYVRDSIWTFAKLGTKKYSSMTRDNFLGFGCSATTLTKNQFKINTFNVEAYIDRISCSNLPTALTIDFSLRQRMVYWLFWRLYTTQLDPKDFLKTFGVSLKSMFGLEFNIGRILGFLKKKKSIYYLTKKGIYYYHYFEGYYTHAYIDKMWHIMRNEPFPTSLEL
ncbi:MAG: radical SAM protein [Defluviitaleaceae bacterium]|nr:radical SAM protein [Defluviitaleaceae bacterium]